MQMKAGWRWYGEKDAISLREIRQAGVTDVVSALYNRRPGEVWPVEEIKAMADEVKNAAYDIISKKHATYYGIAMSAKRICEAIVRDEKSILPVSSIQHGRYGINDVALSVPVIVGKDGIESEVPFALNESEISKLRESAKTLKEVIKSCDLDEE